MSNCKIVYKGKEYSEGDFNNQLASNLLPELNTHDYSLESVAAKTVDISKLTLVSPGKINSIEQQELIDFVTAEVIDYTFQNQTEDLTQDQILDNAFNSVEAQIKHLLLFPQIEPRAKKILEVWDKVKDITKVRIDNYNIDFEDTDTGYEIDDKEDYTDDKSLKVNPYTKIGPDIKKKFFTIPDVKSLKEDGSVEDYKKTWFGLVAYKPINEVASTILSYAADSEPEFDKIRTKLLEHKESKKWFVPLLNSLSDASTPNQVRIQFARWANKGIVNLKYLMYNPDEETFDFNNSNSGRQSDIILDRWKNNILNTGLFTLNEDKEYALDKAKADELISKYKAFSDKYKTIRNKEYPEELFTELKEILDTLGSDIKLDELKRMQKFLDGQGFLYNGVKKGFVTFFISDKSALDFMINKLNGLDSEATETFDNNNPLTNNTGVRAIIRLYSKYESVTENDSYKNSNGDTVYSFSPKKYAIDQFKKLQDVNYSKELAKVQFSSNSKWLEALNSEDSEIRNSFLEHFSIDYLDGVKVKGSNRKKSFEELNETEQEKFRLTTFQNQGRQSNGIRYGSLSYLTMSDKKTLLTVQQDLFKVDLDGESIGNETLERLYDIFKAEYLRILAFNSLSNEDKNKLPDQYRKGADKFILSPWANNIKGINFNKGLTGSEIEKVKEELKKYYNDLIKDKIQSWKDKGIIYQDKGKTKVVFDSKYITYVKSQLPSNATIDQIILYAAVDFEANAQLSNLEVFQTFVGDPASYFKTNLKETMVNIGKRLAAQIAPGDALANTLREDVAGIRGHEYTQVFANDQNLISSNIKYLSKLLDGSEVTDKEIDDFKKYSKLKTEEAKKFMSVFENKYSKSYPYFNIESTDAQEYTTALEHAYNLHHEGKLNDTLYKRLVNKLINKATLSNSDIEVLMQPLKPVYFDGKVKSVGGLQYDDINYIKTSSFPLLEKFTKGTELDKLRVQLESLQNPKQSRNPKDFKMTRMVVKTGIKIGFPQKLANVFNADGTVNDNIDFEGTTKTLSREGYRIQLEVPPKEKDYINRGTQEIKLLLGDLIDHKFESGKTGKQIRRELLDLNDELFSTQLDILKHELQVDNEDNVDLEYLRSKLIKEAINRNFTPNEIEGLRTLSVDSNNKFIIPLIFNTASDKFESLLISLVDNEVRKQHQPGYSSPLGSSAGFKYKNNLEGVDQNKIVWVDGFDPKDNLKQQRIENSVVKGSQILAPWKFRDNNGKLLDIKNFTKEVDGKLIIDHEKLPKELLQSFGFRIPTQGLNSMSYIEIVGFLPYDTADLLIAPPEFTKQMGSDFDIDKLYSYLYNTFYNKGKLSKFEWDKAKEDKFLAEHEPKRKEEIVDKFISALLGQDFKEYIKDKDSDNVYEAKKRKIKHLQNKILDLHFEVLKDPSKEVQSKVVEALGFGDLDKLKSKYDKVADSKAESNLQLNILSSEYQSKKYLAARAGKAGCLGYGTKVLMFDGSFKEVQNIIEGDLLMGIDSTPRTVLQLCRGVEQMYWIKQNRGIDYRVNESHILSTIYKRPAEYSSYTKEGIRKRNFDKILKDKTEKTVNITVKDFIDKNIKYKRASYGYKCSGIEFTNKIQLIDPYYLGLWLGDGATRSITVIHNIDKEIIEHLDNNYGITCEEGLNNITHYIKNDSIGRSFKKIFNVKRMGLQTSKGEYKYIPNDYLYSSKEQRLKLLAGLIDSDGSYCKLNKKYTITSKYEHLANQIAFLTRSLGFYTNIETTEPFTKKYPNGKVYTSKKHYKVNFVPECEIPVLLERKKYTGKSNFKNRLHTGFTVEKDIVDNYYGFVLNGDHLFMLEDLTVTHNTGYFSTLNTFNAIMQGLDLKYTKSTKKGRVEDNLIISSKGTGLSKNVDNKGNLKSYNAVAFQSASVDDEKEQILASLNINAQTFFAIGAWVLDGHSQEDIISVIKQPIIEEFISKLNAYSDIFKDSTKNAKQIVLDELYKKYKELIKDPDINFDELVDRPFSDKQLFDAYENPINTEQWAIIQLAALDKFLKADDVGKQLQKTINAFGIDSKGLGKSFIESGLREKELDEQLVSKTIENINSLYTETIGGLAAKYSLRTVNKLFSKYYPYFTKFNNEVFDNYFEYSKKKDITSNEKLKEYKDVYENIKALIFAKMLNTNTTVLRRELMYGDNSLAKQINALKKNTKNPLILKLNPILAKDENTPDVINIRSIGGELFNEDDLFTGFLDLFSNPATQQLGKDLIDYFYVNGGLQKAREYSKYIPTGFLNASGYANELRNLNLEDLKQAFNITPDDFLKEYFQNNTNKLPKIDKFTKVNEGVIQVSDNPDVMYLNADGESDFLPFIGIVEKVPTTINGKTKNRNKTKMYVHSSNGIYIEVPTKGFRNKYYSALEYDSNISAFNNNNIDSNVTVNTDETTDVTPVKLDNTPVLDNEEYVDNEFKDLGFKANNSLKDIKTILTGIDTATSKVLNELLNNVDSDLTLKLKPEQSVYLKNSNLIILNNKQTSRSRIVDLLQHEVTHAINTKIIDKIIPTENSYSDNFNFEGLTEDQKLSFIRLNNTFKEFRKDIINNPDFIEYKRKLDITRKTIDGGEAPNQNFTKEEIKTYNPYYNLKEFISEAYSNKEFQDKLNSIEYKSGETWLQKLFNDIANFLSKFTFSDKVNAKNVLAQVLYDNYILSNTEVKPISNLAENFTNYSGAAIGADSEWKNIGKKFGIGKQVDYTPQTLQLLNKDQRNEVENAYQKAVKDLNRKSLKYNWDNPQKEDYSGGLVRRDYLQAKASDTIFAISTIIEPGAKDKKGYLNKTNNQIVEGGTGYAVQMAINLGKKVYVFDQLKNKWYKWENNSFIESEIPTLTNKFAGIGTREINEAGKQAIRDVYANTFNPTTQSIVRKTYSGKVTSLQPNQIFVFGSNEGSSKGAAPTHGAGSAKIARDKFGAIQGQSRGLQGQSYAIVTKKFYDVEKSSTPQEIITEIKGLYEYAKQNSTKEFLVSDYSATNLNGYTGQEMADMFNAAGPIPSNIVFNENFDKLVSTTQPTVEPTNLPGPETKINIYAGTGENADLSNFAKRPFVPNATKAILGESANIIFNTVEGAFQAAKVLYTNDLSKENNDFNKSIVVKLQTATGAEAKLLGRQIKGLNSSEWDKVSSNVMKDLISASFEQNPEALTKLLATGNAELTHTQDKGKWGKEFPKLLMEVREELKKETDSENNEFEYKGKSIKTEFPLTKGQKTALDNLIDFVKESDNKTITLQGSAGTGKTSVIGYLQNYLGNKYTFVYMAPTHAATAELAFATVKTGNKDLPMTVQSAFMKRFNPETGKVEYSISKKLKDKLDYTDNIIVLDEVSMLPNSDYDVIKEVIKNQNIKVIFMGDILQIPEVDITNPDKKQVSKAFVDNDQIELTEVKRTSNNDILTILTNLRTNINSKIPQIENSADVKFLPQKDFDLELVNTMKAEPEDSVLINYTNAGVKDNNLKIRKALGRTGDLQKNDVIVGFSGYRSKQIEKGSIANSVRFTVTNVEKEGSEVVVTAESKKLKVLKDNGVKQVPNVFETKYLQLSSDDSFIFEELNDSDFKENNKTVSNILKNVYDSKQDALSRRSSWINYYNNLTKASKFFETHDLGNDYIYNPKTNSMELYNYTEHKALLKSNPELKVDKGIDYGHAITIHKSQGSTVKNVFFNATSLPQATSSKLYKNDELVSTEKHSLIYVGMSRASKKLVVNSDNQSNFYNINDLNNNDDLNDDNEENEIIANYSLSLQEDLGMHNIKFMKSLSKEDRASYRKLINDNIIKINCK